jgi:N-acetylneuraminate 9-O-acetyltransferase
MMHDYEPKEVEFCLKKRKVIFIGDSVTRQLFFSMARLADPTLPAAPANSFEKHSDHSFTSGHGTSFDFIWDPFLNSTKTDTILKDGGYSERNIPGLLVIGSGLWFLRYKEETGGIRAWEATVETVLDKIIRSMPELADEVVMVPGELDYRQACSLILTHSRSSLSSGTRSGQVVS